MSAFESLPRVVRAAEFRARLSVSRSHWHVLRTAGVIPEPVLFAGVQMWSEETVAAFVQRVLRGEFPEVVRRPGRPRKDFLPGQQVQA